jgi:hypothetical protein
VPDSRIAVSRISQKPAEPLPCVNGTTRYRFHRHLWNRSSVRIANRRMRQQGRRAASYRGRGRVCAESRRTWTGLLLRIASRARLTIERLNGLHCVSRARSADSEPVEHVNTVATATWSPGLLCPSKLAHVSGQPNRPHQNAQQPRLAHRTPRQSSPFEPIGRELPPAPHGGDGSKV